MLQSPDRAPTRQVDLWMGPIRLKSWKFMGAQVRDCTDRNIVKTQISILWIFQIYWIKCFGGLASECPGGKVLIVSRVRNLMLTIGTPNQTAKVILSQIYPPSPLRRCHSTSLPDQFLYQFFKSLHLWSKLLLI